MSDLNNKRDQHSIDTGQPISELAGLRVSPSSGFVARVHNSILRRISASEAVDFSVNAFFSTFLEYLSMAFAAFGGNRRQEGKRD